LNQVLFLAKKSVYYPASRLSRRGGRAAECTGLENRQGLIALRGFKSHPLHQIYLKKPKRKFGFFYA
jgi:hypothetical protein